AETLDEDLGAAVRLLGRRLERVELRLREVGRDVRERLRRDRDPALEQLAEPRRDALDDVDLLRADLEPLRHAVGRTRLLLRDPHHDRLALDDLARDRGPRDAGPAEE